MVRAVRDNGLIHIDVEDTGVGLPPGWRLHDTTGTGLRNLASRLAAEFGDTAVLAVAPRDGGGVRATVTLPYTPGAIEEFVALVIPVLQRRGLFRVEYRGETLREILRQAG